MTSTETTDDKRGAYISGLRAVADLLESTPDLPIPSAGGVQFSWNVWPSEHGDDVKTEIARLLRLLPGRFAKNMPSPGSGYDSKYFTLTGALGAASLEICTYRETVCERVVTGTREVVSTVPAPGAPTVEVVETVEDFEWRCHPLLAEVSS